jgi:hypothetical protein
LFAKGKKAIFLSLAIAVLLIAYFGPSAYRKAQMDDEADRLCALDGGARSYEHTYLPRASFDQWGNANIPFYRKASGKESRYVIENHSQKLLEESAFYMRTLILHKLHYKIVRQEDGKVLGEAVSYSRSGGDPVGPWHPSSYRGSCTSDAERLEKVVFKMEN